jgi:hypothetical protein
MTQENVSERIPSLYFPKAGIRMSPRFRRCPSPTCDRPFQVNRFKAALSPDEEAEFNQEIRNENKGDA